MTRVTLSPKISYAGTVPDAATEARLHHEAHELCFLANSVKTSVEIQLGREQGPGHRWE
jgi:organic hydroperoxide reductase OsmC/OhrA